MTAATVLDWTIAAYLVGVAIVAGLLARDPSFDTETDPETRRRPRIGFTAQEDQPR